MSDYRLEFGRISVDMSELDSDKDLYFVVCKKTMTVKIGISDCAEKRLYSLQTANPYKLCLAAVIKRGGNLEYLFHQELSGQRLCGEWFAIDIKLAKLILRIKKLREAWRLHVYG